MVKSNTAKMTVAMLVVLIFIGLPCLEAQSPMGAPVMSPEAMAPATDCMTALTNVSDCLSYVQVGSSMTAPDKACCPEFAGLLESNPICLCQLVGNAEDYGVDIARALMLPDACKVKVPSLNSCPATPESAPTPSPATSDGPGSSAATPESAPTPSPATSDGPGSSAAGPVPDGGTAVTPGNSGSNGASSSAVHDLSTFIYLAVAIFIAYYF